VIIVEADFRSPVVRQVQWRARPISSMLDAAGGVMKGRGGTGGLLRGECANEETVMTGPLAGVKVIEIAGLGAAPYGCMMLADMGAEVVRVDRVGGSADTPENSPLLRNRRSMTLDLKQPAGQEVILAMAAQADVLVEALRPGVAERLGIGPEACLARNSRLVYARMTGWGQAGPSV
jgi:crotonobetainyl-CoA:carnitine CoA-transferase CaiB-like acyl-CoA transferase